jgi:hypothetical protein
MLKIYSELLFLNVFTVLYPKEKLTCFLVLQRMVVKSVTKRLSSQLILFHIELSDNKYIFLNTKNSKDLT